MDSVESNFSKLGKYVVGGLLIWLGLTGLLDVGFTTITDLPLFSFNYLTQAIFIAQVIIGIAIFNRSLRRFVKPIAIGYFLLLVFNFYINNVAVFDPAIPYLSDLGRQMWLEALMIFAGFSYMKRL